MTGYTESEIEDLREAIGELEAKNSGTTAKMETLRKQRDDLLVTCELAKQHLDAMRLESGMGNVLLPFEKAAFEQVDDALTAAIAKAKGE